MANPKNKLQEAFVEYVESIRPDKDRQTSAEIAKVQAALDKKGFWEEYDEWRISTYFNSRIEPQEIQGKKWFKVSVECDTQEFTCACPSVERAYLFSKYYRHIIVNQFYSVGPPWA